MAEAPSDRKRRWVAHAAMLVQAHPEWSDAKIAKTVGKNAAALSRCNIYQDLAASVRGQKEDLPRGHRHKETGQVDAWEEPGES